MVDKLMIDWSIFYLVDGLDIMDLQAYQSTWKHLQQEARSTELNMLNMVNNNYCGGGAVDKLNLPLLFQC